MAPGPWDDHFPVQTRGLSTRMFVGGDLEGGSLGEADDRWGFTAHKEPRVFHHRRAEHTALGAHHQNG